MEEAQYIMLVPAVRLLKNENVDCQEMKCVFYLPNRRKYYYKICYYYYYSLTFFSSSSLQMLSYSLL